jgi:hypothetical protein
MNSLFPHKVRYLSEDEYRSLRIKICHQIYKEEWDNITFSPYSLYRNNLMFAEEVRSILLMNKPYNDDTERTVIRIFGERQYLIEAKQYKSWLRLRYDINNGNIKNLNDSSFPIFIHYMYDYIDNIGSNSIFDNGKFLLDNGANINIQDDKGNTFLHYFINSLKSSSVYFIGLKTYINFLEFLLNNGSDPLLENKEGFSPYSIIMKEVPKQKYVYRSKAKIMEMLDIILNDVNEVYYNNRRDNSDRDNMVRLCEIFHSFMSDRV